MQAYDSTESQSNFTLSSFNWEILSHHMLCIPELRETSKQQMGTQERENVPELLLS